MTETTAVLDNLLDSNGRGLAEPWSFTEDQARAFLEAQAKAEAEAVAEEVFAILKSRGYVLAAEPFISNGRIDARPIIVKASTPKE